MATRPPSSWRLPDIIDYECFLNADEREAPETLHARDRAIFLDAIEPTLPPVDLAAKRKKSAADRERRAILRRWLDSRRQAELQRTGAVGGQEVILPGDAFGQINGMTRWWLVILGVATGWGLATAALLYSAGAEPINAFTFFVEFAVIQAVILLGAFAVLLARHWFPNWQIPSLMRLVWRMMAGLARNLWRKNRVRIAGATRQNAEAVFGILKARNTLYGSTFVWSLVLLTQAFAISFNVGVLGAMTTRHLFHDLDFGWESTWLSAEEVTRGVEIAAAPWAWAVQPGYPSAEQVATSQNRKRNAERLKPESLKSWSHFLFGAVICYGLLPRTLLLLFALRAQRAALRRLRFNDGRSAQLLNRLRTPTVQTHSQNARATAGSLAWAPDPIAASPHPGARGSGGESLAVAPPDDPAPAAPAYWPQVPTAAPMTTAAPAASPAKATDLKSAAPSEVNPTFAQPEPSAPARPTIPAPHPRPPIIPQTAKITLPAAKPAAAPAPDPALTPAAPIANKTSPTQPTSATPPASAPKLAAPAPVTKTSAPAANTSIPSTVTPTLPDPLPAAITPTSAPVSPPAPPPTKPPTEEPAAVVAPAIQSAPSPAPAAKAAPVVEPPKPSTPAPITERKTDTPPAPIAAPAKTAPSSGFLAPAATVPPPVQQPPAPAPAATPAPTKHPAPAAAPAPKSVVPSRSAADAETLLVLNLTGRPFTTAQAAETAGHPSANGSAALFEAGTLSLEQDEQAFAALKQRAAAQPDAEVFALIASWTAPMVASKLLLDQLRASVGRDRLINLVLVGRPALDGSYKPVRPNDRALWSAAVQARGDAFLSLF